MTFGIPSPFCLSSSSKVQQLYYTELRQKVLRSQSRHQEALFYQLAASALQAEVGDLEQQTAGNEEKEEKTQERKHRCYFLPEDYFPSWVTKINHTCCAAMIRGRANKGI